MRTLRTHKRFLILLILFIVGGLIHNATLPVLEGNDEVQHYNYVRWLRVERRTAERAPERAHLRPSRFGQDDRDAQSYAHVRSFRPFGTPPECARTEDRPEDGPSDEYQGHLPMLPGSTRLGPQECVR